MIEHVALIMYNTAMIFVGVSGMIESAKLREGKELVFAVVLTMFSVASAVHFIGHSL